MGIPNSTRALFLAAAGQATGGAYEISRSLRFNSSDSAYLSRTPSTAGNRKTWTWAGWVKRSGLNPGGASGLFLGGTNPNRWVIEFSNDYLYVGGSIAGSDKNIAVSALFRDVSAWYHIVIACDTTQATTTDRVKFYVNGTRLTDFVNSTGFPAQNTDLAINDAVAHQIGNDNASGGRYFNGYLADIHFIDGQALDPTSFGEFDTNGVWQPKEYTGTYPGNSFHLPFSDNSTAAALGTDTSEAGNDWTVNNITVAAGGVVGSYVSGITASGPYNGPIVNAFDGNLSTVLWADVNSPTMSNTTSYATFSFNTPITNITTLEFALDWYGTYTSTSPPNDLFQVNGISYATAWVSAGYPMWFTVPQTTLNSFRVGFKAGPYSGYIILDAVVRVRAIRINGSILIDQSKINAFLASNDSLVDTPTNGSQTDTGVGGEVVGNYCTLNPVSNGTGTAPTNGNLNLAVKAAVSTRCNSTIGVSSGKWYFETTLVTAATDIPRTMIGIGQNYLTTTYPGGDALSYGFALEYGAIYNNNVETTGYGSTLTDGDIFMCAFDLDDNKIFFGKNGTWYDSSDPETGTSPAFTLTPGTYCPCTRPRAAGGGGPTPEVALNLGQRPFAYTAPSGFKALCTTNLPDPVVAKPSEVMDVALYTGNGSTQTISGLGFSPDLVWIKSRSQNLYHFLVDTVRGNTKTLSSNTTDGESFATETVINSFDSSGFTLNADDGAGYYGWNMNSASLVAWAWDAGSSTVTNTQGSITSQVRANPSAGFSIVSWTGTSASGTIGHGLNDSPKMIIIKSRSGSTNWVVLTTAVDGSNDYLYLNLTNAKGNDDNLEITSSIFNPQSGSNANPLGAAMIAYCFAPVAGYSAFGSYTGNGSADGSFIYLGFLPKVILIKRTDTTSNWTILDTSREGYNVDNDPLYPNLSNAEGTTDLLDITSNGFKLRTTDASVNASGGTYIYAAWASNPFQYSRAR